MQENVKQIILVHIFPNTSRNKGNQAIKFGPLGQYSLRNFSSNIM